MELFWADHLYIVLIGIFIPLQSAGGARQQLRSLEFDTRLRKALYWGNSFFLWLLAGGALLIWWLADRPWSLLGFRRAENFWIMPALALAAFVVLYLAETISELTSAQSRQKAAEELRDNLRFLPETGEEFFHYLFLAISAGICEEIIYRGFFIRYFQVVFIDMDPSGTVAILLPAVIFGVVHLYQGWEAVIKVSAMAILFGYVFIHTNSLWPLIAIHIGIDFLGGLLGWALLRK